VDISWIKGPENNADAFTKNLDGPVFEKCSKALVGQDVHMKKSPTSEQGGCQERYPKVLRRVSRILIKRGFAECKPILYF
jgi:hypothetical protein